MIEKIFTSISASRIAWAIILTMIVLYVLAHNPMHIAIIAALFALIIYTIGWQIEMIISRRRQAQPNTTERKYLEQRIEMLMKNRHTYRTTSPDCHTRFTITKDQDEHNSITYRVAFTEEEFLRAGETNGNINTRTEKFYLITPNKHGVVIGTSVSQVYANNDTEGNATIRYSCPDHLPEDDFVQIEAALTWT